MSVKRWEVEAKMDATVATLTQELIKTAQQDDQIKTLTGQLRRRMEEEASLVVVTDDNDNNDGGRLLEIEEETSVCLLLEKFF